MSSLFETQLSDALHEAADKTYADDATVERLITDSRYPAPRVVSKHYNWLLPLLAAAAVVVLASAAALLARAAKPDSRPADSPIPSSPTTSASAPTTTAPTTTAPTTTAPTTSLYASACIVTAPPGWETAQEIRPPGVADIQNTAGLRLLAISPNGDAVTYSDALSQNDAATGNLKGQLVLVEPNRSTQVLYKLPTRMAGQKTLRIASAQIDSQWIVFDVLFGDGQGARGELEAINRTTGSVVDLRDAGLGTAATVSPPQLLNHHVYWSEVDGDGQGHVYGYDLVNFTRTAMASGAVGQPQVVGGALEWAEGGNVVWQGIPDLPTGFSVAANKVATLLHDGSTYAWSAWSAPDADGQQYEEILLLKAGQHSPTVAVAASKPNGDTFVTPLALSGQYLTFDDGRNIVVLDTDTAASFNLIGSEQPFTPALAADNFIAYNFIGSKGGSHLSILHTPALAEPHC